jgi:hypothetical protein
MLALVLAFGMTGAAIADPYSKDNNDSKDNGTSLSSPSADKLPPPTGRDVWGNPLGVDVHGNPNDKNAQGMRPKDVQGNPPKDFYGNETGSDHKP